MQYVVRYYATWAQATRPGQWIARHMARRVAPKGTAGNAERGQEIIQMMIVLIVVVLALLPFLGNLTKALEDGFNAIVSQIQQAIQGGAN